MRIPRPAIALALFACTLAAKRPLKLEDVYALKDAGEVQVAPDASAVLYTETTKDPEANRSKSRLMRIGAGGGAPVEIPGLPEGISNLRWAPDSRRAAFLAGNGVWVVDIAGGKSARLCDYDRSNSFLSKAGNALAWSPDGARLAFAGTTDPEPGLRDPLVITRMQYKTRTAIWDGRRMHVFVVKASGGKPAPVTSGNFDEHSIDWSAGSEIVFLSNRQPDPDAVLNYDIFAIDPDTGAQRQITHTPGVEMEPRISPDGRSIAYTATTRPLTTIDSVAEDAHVWVIPMAGGAAHEVNPGLDRRCSAPIWTDGGKVVYTAADHGKTVIYRGVERIFDRAAQAGSVSAARNGALVFAVSDPATPRDIFALDRTGARPLISLNAISDFELVPPETITFQSSDGAEVQAWLYPALHPAGRSPLILNIHGGPHGMYGYAFNGAWQYSAARGYATLAVNPRGSSGYGQKFSDGCVGNWGGGDYRDLMAALDYVLRTHKQLDPDKLGVMGGSYGGFMTNWVITQTPRFKAAVAIASLSNLVSFYATSLYQDLVHAEFNGFPWNGDNFDLLWKWSPLHYIKSVSTPTLFIHGEQDNDVHITQAEEMYTALKRRGIATEMVRYPREGHGFREPKHQMDSQQRALAWMDRYLK